MPGKKRPTRTGLYSCDRLGCNWSRETNLQGYRQHLRSCNKPVDHSNRGNLVRQDPYAKTKRDSDLSSGICGLIHQHEAYQKSSEDVEMQDREHFNETRTHINNRFNPQPNIQTRIRTAMDTNNKNDSTKNPPQNDADPPQNDADDNADFGGGDSNDIDFGDDNNKDHSHDPEEEEGEHQTHSILFPQRNRDGAPVLFPENIIRNHENEEDDVQLANLAEIYKDLCGEKDVSLHPVTIGTDDIDDEEDFDEDESVDPSGWEKYCTDCPDKKKWMQECKGYAKSLPRFYVALLDLLKILSNHRVDLKVFDSIVGWVIHHSSKEHDLWTSHEADKCPKTRSAFIKFLSKAFHTEHLLPTNKEAKLVNGEKVQVPCFDFEEVFKELVTDKELNHPDNLIQEGMNKRTWQPDNSMDDWTDDDIINDVNTGEFFHRGSRRFGLKEGQPLPDGIDEVRPVGLNFFIDKSHTDVFGVLSTTPVSFTCTHFNNIARRKIKFWRQIAFLPSLSHGKGTKKGYDHDREVKIAQGKKSETYLKKDAAKRGLQNSHILFEVAFRGLKKVQREGGVVIEQSGRRIKFVPYIACIIGDAVGANEMCSHFNSNGCLKVKALCNKCKCGADDLIAYPPKCRLITLDDINRSLIDEEFAKSISQHQVKSALNDLMLVDHICGIHGMTPYENLHVFGNGLFADSILVLHDMFGKDDCNNAAKDELDMIFRLINVELGRSSERDLPRFTSRFGCLDGTRVTGSERIGIVYILCIVLRTTWGESLLRKYIEGKPYTVEKVRQALTALLSFDRWTQDRNIRRWELNYADAALCELMEKVIKHLPKPRVVAEKSSTQNKKKGNKTTPPAKKRKEKTPKKKKESEKKSKHKLPGGRVKKGKKGSNGWHKIKFHAMWHILNAMRMYGSATNFHGGPGEEHHKENVKKKGWTTQRRNTSFTCQIADRGGEQGIVNVAHKRVEDRCVQPKGKKDSIAYDYSASLDQSISSSNINSIKKIGMYTITMGNTMNRAGHSTRRKDIEWSYNWGETGKNLLNIQPHQSFVHALSAHAQKPTEFRDRPGGNGRKAQKGAPVPGSEAIPIPHQVECYTEIRIPSRFGQNKNLIYRASPDYRGFPWYDYALIKGIEKDDFFIGQIRGIFRYKTAGIVTPSQLENGDLSRSNDVDPTLYVALHCSNEYFKLDDFNQELTVEFELTNKSDLYLLPVTCLYRPLLVVSNWEKNSTGHVSCSEKKLACMPMHKWGVLFRNRIHYHRDNGAPSHDNINEDTWSEYKIHLKEMEDKNRRKDREVVEENEEGDHSDEEGDHSDEDNDEMKEVDYDCEEGDNDETTDGSDEEEEGEEEDDEEDDFGDDYTRTMLCNISF